MTYFYKPKYRTWYGPYDSPSAAREALKEVGGSAVLYYPEEEEDERDPRTCAREETH